MEEICCLKLIVTVEIRPGQTIFVETDHFLRTFHIRLKERKREPVLISSKSKSYRSVQELIQVYRLIAT